MGAEEAVGSREAVVNVLSSDEVEVVGLDVGLRVGGGEGEGGDGLVEISAHLPPHPVCEVGEGLGAEWIPDRTTNIKFPGKECIQSSSFS